MSIGARRSARRYLPVLAALLLTTIEETDPEETRELVGQLLGFLGLAVGAVILLLVLGLPLRSWLRQRRRRGDP